VAEHQGHVFHRRKEPLGNQHTVCSGYATGLVRKCAGIAGWAGFASRCSRVGGVCRHMTSRWIPHKGTEQFFSADRKFGGEMRGKQRV
jgi:hypothetical protein